MTIQIVVKPTAARLGLANLASAIDAAALNGVAAASRFTAGEMRTLLGSKIYPPASSPYTSPAMRTGNLMSSTTSTPGSAIGPNRYVSEIRNDAARGDHSYGRYLEEGTEHMDERPYFKTTVDNNIQQMVDIIRIAIQRVL